MAEPKPPEAAGTPAELNRVLSLPLVERARAGGITESEVLGLAQAYIRGITRIIAAETHVTARAMAEAGGSDRAEWLDGWLGTMTPLTGEMFEAIHAPALEAASRAMLSSSGDPRPAQLVVAFVDLRGSTAFMHDSTAAQISALVDGIFVASQAISESHAVTVSKHLGDGVLLVGPDLGETQSAAGDLIAELQIRTPLRASAGIDFGAVTERAGDLFGPPVNFASRLAEVAPAEGMLLSGNAVPEPVPSGQWETIDVRGLSESQRVFRISRRECR